MVTPRGLTGGPRRLLTLASAAKEMGIDIIIASEADSDLILKAQALGLSTAPMKTVGVLGLRGGRLLKGSFLFRAKVAVAILRNNLVVAGMIHQQRADAVWIRGSKGFAFAGFGTIFSRRPVIWDVDGEPRTSGVAGALLSVALRLSHATVVQYQSAMENIFHLSVQMDSQHRVRSILPGIDLTALTAHRNERLKVNGLRTRFKIIQVGSICDNKNQIFTIDAISKLQNIESVELWFLGGTLDRPSQALLQAKIGEYGLGACVVFAGWRDDIHSLMAGADLLLMPSKDEGVPNTIQEAMAIGLPVIVSNAGGMPEIVKHGKTGWVLQVDDSESWARQIDTCRHEPELCRAVGEAAAAYAEEHFGTASWCREYADVIKSVIR